MSFLPRWEGRKEKQLGAKLGHQAAGNLFIFEFLLSVITVSKYKNLYYILKIFNSLAASLLPSGSTATVGFGGYVGSSRLDSSLAGDDSVPFLVGLQFSL